MIRDRGVLISEVDCIVLRVGSYICTYGLHGTYGRNVSVLWKAALDVSINDFCWLRGLCAHTYMYIHCRYILT